MMIQKCITRVLVLSSNFVEFVRNISLQVVHFTYKKTDVKWPSSFKEVRSTQNVLSMSYLVQAA